MSDAATTELLGLTEKLLRSIAEGDWTTYTELCDPSLTAFEPEAVGHLIHGMEFHHFYFKLAGGQIKPQNTVCDPHVRVMGDVAVVSYYRLTQVVEGQNSAASRGTEETRVWQRTGGVWKHVHFHRSPPKSA